MPLSTKYKKDIEYFHYKYSTKEKPDKTPVTEHQALVDEEELEE